MPWLQMQIETTKENAELIEQHLLDLGALSVTFMDSQDCPIFEPLPGETRLWNEVVVTGLFDAETDMEYICDELIRHNILLQAMPYKIERLEDKDWEREWMKDFKPMQFGQKLWICPSWLPVPDPEAVNVMLDPGLAFGTGTHPTTALCLEWLEQLDLKGRTVIDFGCGSGILAIAALKLGAEKVIGIDIDPQALLASRQNALSNNVSDDLALYLAEDVPEELSADIIIANILAAPLRELSEYLCQHLLKSSGRIGLSGILDSQVESIQATYKQFIQLDDVVYRSEWCRVTGQKM